MATSRNPACKKLSLDAVLLAFSDPVRRAIVRELAEEGEKACGTFCICSSMPKSSRSHHFGILRQSGVVVTRRRGKELLNTLAHDDLNRSFPGLLEALLKGSVE